MVFNGLENKTFEDFRNVVKIGDGTVVRRCIFIKPRLLDRRVL